MQNNDTNGVILALDVGNSRIGVARAHTFAKLPEPVAIINVKKQDVLAELNKLIKQTDAIKLVIGLPLLASGQDSEQTVLVRDFAATYASQLEVPYEFVDESYSSQDADTYMGNHKTAHVSNDAIAACVILERYLESL